MNPPSRAGEPPTESDATSGAPWATRPPKCPVCGERGRERPVASDPAYCSGVRYYLCAACHFKWRVGTVVERDACTEEALRTLATLPVTQRSGGDGK